MSAEVFDRIAGSWYNWAMRLASSFFLWSWSPPNVLIIIEDAVWIPLGSKSKVGGR
ncbi:MAG: hypothetical protein ABIB93_07300 [Chloroflexota bacterium]